MKRLECVYGGLAGTGQLRANTKGARPSPTATRWIGLILSAATLVACGSDKNVARPPASDANSATSSAPHEVTGDVLDVVARGRARLVRAVDPSLKMHLTLVLRPRDANELHALVDSVSDPASPNFGHFLTLAEANERFSPTQKDVDAVADWAGKAGLHVLHRFASNHAVTVSGTVEAVSRALQVTLNEYQYENRSFFANNRAVTLPETITPIVREVFGLESARQFSSTRAPHAAVDWPAPVWADAPYEPTIQEVHSGTESRARLSPEVTGRHGGTVYEPSDLWSSQAYNFGRMAKLTDCCTPSATPPAQAASRLSQSSKPIAPT